MQSPLLQRLSLLLLLLFFGSYQVTNSQPLSTRGRWLIDAASGQRVKLRCVNWAAHMPAVMAEGLDKQPLKSITMRAASLGFNCVRLTYATHLFTKEEYMNLTVGESLRSLGLVEALNGLGRNNEGMVGMGVREAYDEVVKAIGDAGMMVVLDNHVSKPKWCCAGDDGNGFFGDMYFDPDEWLRGLDFVARRFRHYSQVIGLSMRNELRGPRESEAAWYKNMAQGASKIHEANSDVLVIVSGLHYDTDLSFLLHRPLNSTYDNKLVFEAHWYSFGQRQDWANKSPNSVCSGATKTFDKRAAFLAQGDDEAAATPLFVSEFGVDQRGWNRADNRFLSCFLSFAAERDLDWALWTLQGSYYERKGVVGLDETYGVLDANWDQPRNPKFQQRFRLIQQMLQDPDSSKVTYQIIYHPHSGKCLSVDGNTNSVLLSDCLERSRWSYNEGGGSQVQLIESSHCLRVAGDGLPVVLSPECADNLSTWSVASGSRHQIFVMDLQGRELCLEGNSTEGTILTRECLCLPSSTCSENPQIQWFKFVPSNI